MRLEKLAAREKRSSSSKRSCAGRSVGRRSARSSCSAASRSAPIRSASCAASAAYLLASSVRPRELGVMREPGGLRRGDALRERGHDRGVQRGAPGCGDRALDRLSDQLVAEAERGAVVGEHTARERLLHRIRGIGRDGGQEVERDALADDGRRVHRSASHRAQPTDARQRGVAHGRRQSVARRERLDDEEGVPAGQAPQPVGVDVGRPGQAAHRLVRQGFERHAGGRRAGDEVSDQHRQRGVHGQLVVAIGDDDDDPGVLDAAREQAQHVHRRRVGPMGVLQHGHGGRPRAQLAEHRLREGERVVHLRRLRADELA
jgi:hypothetical protein